MTPCRRSAVADSVSGAGCVTQRWTMVVVSASQQPLLSSCDSVLRVPAIYRADGLAIVAFRSLS